MISAITWNVRGANKKSSRRRLKKLIKIHNICLVAILEPKLLPTKLNTLCNSLGFSGFVANLAAEKYIWVLWDHRLKVNMVAAHEQALTMEVSFLGTEVFLVSFIYAKCDHVLRRPLWDHLASLQQSSFSWMIVGDFNTIVSSTERKGGATPSLSIMQ